MGFPRPCLALLVSLLAGCGGGDSPPHPPGPGAFDTAFGSQGIAVIDPPPGQRSYAAAVAVDSQGRAVVGGSEVPRDTTDLLYRPLFARFTGEGVLDPSWAAGGVFRRDVYFLTEAEGTYVTSLADDRTVLGERNALRCGKPGQPACGPTGQSNFFFAQRHRADGTIDDSYGVMATVSISVTRPAIASFGGGALAVFGPTNAPTPDLQGTYPVFIVQRVDERGQIEMPYSIAAQTSLAGLLGGAIPEDVKAVVLPGGRVVVAMQSAGRILLAWLLADGTLDVSHGIQGSYRELDALVPRPDGAVAVIAHSLSPVPTSGRIVTAVTPVTREGIGATLEIDPDVLAIVTAATADAEGRLLLAGFPQVARTPPAPGVEMDFAHPRLLRLDASGKPDAAFGPSGAGYAPLESGGRTLGARHMVRAPDGSLYIVGTVPADASFDKPTAFAVGKLGS